MTHNVATRMRRKGSLRSLLSLLVLLVFTTQSFLVQTHLHDLPKISASAAGTLSASAPQDDQAPISADKCLLCQEYTHSGGFVLPAAVATLPPNAVLSLLPLVLAPLDYARTASHAWNGRAPPHA